MNTMKAETAFAVALELAQAGNSVKLEKDADEGFRVTAGSSQAVDMIRKTEGLLFHVRRLRKASNLTEVYFSSGRAHGWIECLFSTQAFPVDYTRRLQRILYRLERNKSNAILDKLRAASDRSLSEIRKEFPHV